MNMWAIQWGPYPTNPRSKGWIDHTTVSMKRSEAWKRFAENESPDATISGRTSSRSNAARVGPCASRSKGSTDIANQA